MNALHPRLALHFPRFATILLALTALATPARAGGGPSFEVETYTLDNGLTVMLHRDTSLPQVVISTRFNVGSKDEAVRRTGFAHLFEHLMFMGTGRVPEGQFDTIMESGGGSNNAWTSRDSTSYHSSGPSSLLPTLLWLDAERLSSLADFMTRKKLDAQRDVVRDERRQRSENTPYGMTGLVIPEDIYPEGHPYHHPVIGSHEDLEAATVEDVVNFFHQFYVPANATLVIAGDFETDVAKALVERTFGAVKAAPLPEHKIAPEVKLTGERRHDLADNVQFPRLYLVWPSPAWFGQGDAEMDLVAAILADGPSSRLQQRLIYTSGLAQDVVAYQSSGELGSEFVIFATAKDPSSDLEAIKAAILEEIDRLLAGGPRPDELARVQASIEASFLRRQEGLLERAESFQVYYRYLGSPNAFQRDLDRWLTVTPAALKATAASVLGDGRLDLRVFPKVDETSLLDERPADLAPKPFVPPVPQAFQLANGSRVVAMSRPGTALFSGRAISFGGEERVPAEKAGLPQLLGRMLESGAGGRSAADFAAAADELGASIGASGGMRTVDVSVEGLTSRMAETLDLFADVLLRPNLEEEDFERERGLQLAELRSRVDDPGRMAREIAAAWTYGTDDWRGRPLVGTEASLAALDVDDVRESCLDLMNPRATTFVFAGDFTIEELRSLLDQRFGKWEIDRRPVEMRQRPLDGVAKPGIVLFDRPNAPQTVVWISRPIPPPVEALDHAARRIVDTVLGGSFTSRLNSNLREDKGYTYGAYSRLLESGGQHTLIASAQVTTEVTGAALSEFRSEFQRLASEGVTLDEVDKARKTLLTAEMGRVETTSAAAGTLAGRVREGRPIDGAPAEIEALRRVTDEVATAIAGSGVWSFDDLLIVLVGDAGKVGPQLAEAGFAKPAIVDAKGQPLE